MDNAHTLTKNRPTAIPDIELLNVFPEAVPVVKRLIKSTKQKIEEINKAGDIPFRAALERFYTLDGDPDHEEIFTILAKFQYLDLPMQLYRPDGRVRVTMTAGMPVPITLQSELERLERILRFDTYREAIHNSPDEVNEATIENAKSRKIEEFLSERPNHAGFIRCPFHNEKTASCKLNGGRFHCFGCGADGDVIDWVMKMQGKDFLNAVRFLSKI